MVLIRLDNSYSYLFHLDKFIRGKIDIATSYKVVDIDMMKGIHYKNKKLMRKFKDWDGKKHLLTAFDTFPTGLLHRVKYVLEKYGYEYEIEDIRKIPRSTIRLQFTTAVKDFEDRPYQEKVRVIVKKVERGVLSIATAGGKTWIAANIIKDKSVPTLFITPSITLLHQTYKKYVKFFGEKYVGLYTSDISKEEKEKAIKKYIVVANVDSLERAPDALFRRGMVIYDELHHFGAVGYYEINKTKLKHIYYKYGLTATFWRESVDTLMLYGVLSRVIFRKSASELIRENYLVRPYITIEEIRSPELYGKTYKKAYKQGIVLNSIRNNIIAKYAMHWQEQKKPTIILVTELDHGDILKSMIPNSVFLHGKHNEETRDAVIKDYEDQKIPTLICTAILAEGADIPIIRCGINARANQSDGMTMQGIGRGLRLHKASNKDRLQWLDFLDNINAHLLTHSKARYRAYKSEEEFKIRLKRFKI